MKRLISAILLTAMMIVLLPVTAMATDDYIPMTTSQAMIDIIKDFEGFVSTPYYDGGQYSVGYGTGCGYSYDEVPAAYWNGITEDEGEQLLRQYLENVAEDELNSFYRRIGYQPSQQQFDAMIDFTYNLGGSWIYESSVRNYIVNHTDGSGSQLEFVNLLGAWCRADGVQDYLCSRRIREALVYFHGEYYLPHGNVESDLEVVSDSQLPRYKYVIYNGNGAGISPSGYEDTVAYFAVGEKYGDMLVPTRSGYTFAGWYDQDGALLLSAHRVQGHQKVKAAWAQVPFTDIAQDKWYTAPVAYCYQNGYMVGTAVEKFSYGENITRAMLTGILYSMAGKPAVSGDTGFTDIIPGAYYEKAIIWARQNGIISQEASGRFDPNRPLTRSEMVAMIYQYAANVAGLDMSGCSDVSGYEDANEIPAYAVEKFGWAIHVGLIVGTTETTLGPQDYTNRGQVALQIMYLKNLK